MKFLSSGIDPAVVQGDIESDSRQLLGSTEGVQLNSTSPSCHISQGSLTLIHLTMCGFYIIKLALLTFVEVCFLPVETFSHQIFILPQRKLEALFKCISFLCSVFLSCFIKASESCQANEGRHLLQHRKQRFLCAPVCLYWSIRVCSDLHCLCFPCRLTENMRRLSKYSKHTQTNWKW